MILRSLNSVKCCQLTWSWGEMIIVLVSRGGIDNTSSVCGRRLDEFATNAYSWGGHPCRRSTYCILRKSGQHGGYLQFQDVQNLSEGLRVGVPTKHVTWIGTYNRESPKPFTGLKMVEFDKPCYGRIYVYSRIESRGCIYYVQPFQKSDWKKRGRMTCCTTIFDHKMPN